MATLLVTGATGLVGSRLLPRLAQDGFECRALVRGDVALPPGTTGVRVDLADPGTPRVDNKPRPRPRRSADGERLTGRG